MTSTALCIGGPAELHRELEASFSSADVALRTIAAPLVGPELEAFQADDPKVDIFVWAVAAPSAVRFETLTGDDVRAYLNRTLFSAFSMLQACLGGMERRRFGRILALTNMGSHAGDEDLLAASMSAGLEGLVRSVARETARKNVTANALVLGQIEGWPEATAKISEPFYEVYFPFREPFRLAELAKTIVELTTSPVGKINGQLIGFDGGTML